MATININKAKGYLNLAKSGGYVIFGTDNLKGYTHKLYLVIFREDGGKTIEKALDRLKVLNIEQIQLSIEDFNLLVGTQNCKILGIKNKGLSVQIIKNLRGEDDK